MLNLFFIFKVISLSIYIIIIRGTLPRYRIDQFLFGVWKGWVFIWLFFLGISILFHLSYLL